MVANTIPSQPESLTVWTKTSPTARILHGIDEKGAGSGVPCGLHTTKPKITRNRNMNTETVRVFSTLFWVIFEASAAPRP